MPQSHDDVSRALENVMERFGGLIRQTARFRGIPDGEVDEVLQDVRIRLWRSLGAGEKISTANTSYVRRTAVSAAVDLVRSRRAKREAPLPAYGDPSPATNIEGGTPVPATPMDLLAREELGNRLEAAIGQLAKPRAVAVRMYLAGYPREEIAELLGWTEARTRNLLYRGLTDLRSWLTTWGLDPGTANDG